MQPNALVWDRAAWLSHLHVLTLVLRLIVAKSWTATDYVPQTPSQVGFCMRIQLLPPRIARFCRRKQTFWDRGHRFCSFHVPARWWSFGVCADVVAEVQASGPQLHALWNLGSQERLCGAGVSPARQLPGRGGGSSFFSRQLRMLFLEAQPPACFSSLWVILCDT